MSSITRVYVGPLRSGKVQLPTRTVPFTRGVPVEVTSEEADLLDDHWVTEGVADDPVAAAVGDDLDGLAKAALVKVADDEGLDVNRRLGAPRLADEIRQARAAATSQES